MHRKQKVVAVLITILLLVLIILFGSAPPSPVYFIKIARESVQELFVFGSQDKAYWLLTKAEKRITEAEKLKSKNFTLLVNIQADTANTYQAQALEIITHLKDEMDTNYLTDKYNQNKDRLGHL